MTLFLQSIYEGNQDENESLLYQLLSERQPSESISHNEMPTIKQHQEFVRRKPYKAWYIIYADSLTKVGSVYLSYTNEIGIAILSSHRRKGYGEKAIKKLVDMHLTEPYFLANINPQNDKSVRLFTGKLEFKHVQCTYKFERKPDIVY